MNGLYMKLATAVVAVSVLFSSSITAQSGPNTPQELPPSPQAKRMHITQGPALESADDTSAIIRWTSNNPGGADEHYGVVHYGTNPRELSQTAKSHIRLNRGHSYTVFRVRVEGLAPRTTYYYTVDSMEPNGNSDGVKSPVRHFRTSGAGERIAAQTAQPDPRPK
jgi:phosphodiesterase/alkaline phosphatase D-like protein